MKHVLSLLLILAPPVGAHPHIFVDTGIEVIVDDEGRATHVRVSWAYDALFSLLVTEDMGLDADGDAVLTPAEEAKLVGFDTNWIAGYNGDLVATLDGQPVGLSRPSDPTAKMREGRIVSSHLRQIKGTPKLGGGVLVFKPYDPTFYTAYDVTLGVKVTGRDGCKAALAVPEVSDELLSLKSELMALDQNSDATLFGGPDIGASFATEVRITCAD